MIRGRNLFYPFNRLLGDRQACSYPENVQSPVTGRPIHLLGGALCLDFVNTLVPAYSTPPAAPDPRPEPPLADFLPTFEALITWVVYAGALDPAGAAVLAAEADRAPGRAAALHTRAIRLRAALYEVLRPAGWPGPHAAALAVVNAELRQALAGAELIPAADRYQLIPGPGSGLEQVFWPITRSAAELLTSDDISRVGECGGRECGWLFLDTSKAGRRRWCSMALCGNREKARRHRESASPGRSRADRAAPASA
jgi:predicted RNA-binding Zn ribbon-like protein